MNRTHTNAGYILVGTLVALAVISLLGAASLTWATSSLRLTRKAVENEQAFYLANAGIEDAVAQVLQGGNPDSLSRSVAVAQGVTGAYAVTLSPLPENMVQVVSVGTVGASSQRLTAEVKRPGAEAHAAYQSLLYTSGNLVLENQTHICGDAVVAGNVELRAQVNVWNQTVAQNSKSPCDSIFGSGRLTSGGNVSFQNSQIEIQGGACAANLAGADSRCSASPRVAGLPEASAEDFRAKATHSFLPDCTGQPPGTCTPISGGRAVLSGSRTYNGDVIFVDGDLLIPSQGLSIGGAATIVVTGQIRYEGGVTAPPGCASCAAAFLSQGTQWVAKQTEVRGLFMVLGEGSVFGWDQHVTVRGTIAAPGIEPRHHLTLYPGIADVTSLLPDLPGAKSSPGGLRRWTR